MGLLPKKFNAPVGMSPLLCIEADTTSGFGNW
jgi:hypothetical protein